MWLFLIFLCFFGPFFTVIVYNSCKKTWAGVKGLSMILIIVLYLVFSAMTFINSKLMLGNPYPFFVGMLRAWFSAVFLLGYSWLIHKKFLQKFSLSKSGWRDLIIFGVLVHGFVMCGFSFGAQYTDPVKICFIFALCPFITAILQYFLHQERLTPKKIAGLCLGFIGLIPIMLDMNHGAYKALPLHLEVLGVVVIFVSTAFFAYGWIVMKRFLKHHSHYPIELINGISMTIGGAVSCLLFVIDSRGALFSISLTNDFPVWMFAFAAFSLLTYMLYPHLLKSYSATFIAFAGFLEPVFGMMYGILFWGGTLTFLSALSLVILFCGLYIFYRAELEQNRKNGITVPSL